MKTPITILIVDDEPQIRRLLEKMGVVGVLEAADDRGTIVKTRFVGSGQQMLRVDREKSTAIPAAIEDRVIEAASKMMLTAGAVILSD